MRFKFLVVVLTLVVSVSALASDHDHGAFVLKIDEAVCGIFTPTTFSLGTIHFVLNDSYQWVLSCHGDLVDGDNPRKAIVRRSSDDDPVDTCNTPFGATNNMHVVVTPSGKSKMTCWGMVSY